MAIFDKKAKQYLFKLCEWATEKSKDQSDPACIHSKPLIETIKSVLECMESIKRSNCSPLKMEC